MNTVSTDEGKADKSLRAGVENSVKAIIVAGVLGKSERRAHLLQYLVENELAGRGGDIKAFSIALDVLGRDASFDASTDSIVRSEVGRLRDALQLYFAQETHADQIRIDIPKGTYRPTFSLPQHSGKTSAATPNVRFIGVALVALLVLIGAYVFGSNRPALTVDRPISLSELPYEVIRISVNRFDAAGENRDAEKLAFGISSELVMDLSAYPWISVVSSVDPSARREQGMPDYVLSGDAFWDGDSVLAHARLVSVAEEEVIWSSHETYSANAETIRNAVVDVSSQIASRLGSIHGIAPQLAKARSAQVSAEGLDAFLCYLGLHKYMVDPTEEYHLEMRTCLTEAVSAFPNFGDAWAALGLIYMDEGRFRRNARAGADPWQDARMAVEQALKFSPTRMTTLNAALILSIESPTPDLEDFERFSNLLINLFPRHPPTQYIVGSRLAEFAGQWEQGLDLVENAIELETDPPSAYFVTRAYKAALTGTDKDALFATQKLTTHSSTSQLLLNYLAASRNNLRDDMLRYRNLLGREGLSQDADIVNHVRGRRYVAELEVALLAQLDAAFAVERTQ